MKGLILVMLSTGLWLFTPPASPGYDNGSDRERAVVEFRDSVKFHDVVLRGRYLLVHDETKMAQGQPCFYIYTEKRGEALKLVTSFHCKSVIREPADEFRIVIARSRTPFELPEVQEVQFAGFVKAHRMR
jgi:hypothetical protein